MFCGSVVGTWQAKNQSARAHHILEGETGYFKVFPFWCWPPVGLPFPSLFCTDPDPDTSISYQKKGEKILIPFCDFFTFYVWKLMKMYLQKVISINFEKNYFLLASCQPLTKKQDPDPKVSQDPVPNVTDPQHLYQDESCRESAGKQGGGGGGCWCLPQAPIAEFRLGLLPFLHAFTLLRIFDQNWPCSLRYCIAPA